MPEAEWRAIMDPSIKVLGYKIYPRKIIQSKHFMQRHTSVCAASREVAGAFFIILTLPHTFAEEALGYL